MHRTPRQLNVPYYLGKEPEMKPIGWCCPNCGNRDMTSKKNQCTCFIDTDDKGINFINMVNKNKIQKQWKRLYIKND